MKKNLILSLTISFVVVIIYALMYKFTNLLPEGNEIIWGYTDIEFLNFPDKSLLPSISFFWQVSIIFLSVFSTFLMLKSIAIKIDKKLFSELYPIWFNGFIWTATISIFICIDGDGLGLLIYGSLLSVGVSVVPWLIELNTRGNKNYRQCSYPNGVFPISFATSISVTLCAFCFCFSLNLTFLFIIIFLYSFILYCLSRALNKKGIIMSDRINLTVNYDQSLKQMIAEGKYCRVSKRIKESEFPLPHELIGKKKEISARLINFKSANISWYSSDYVLSKISGLGYRPANFPELLALGSQYPNLQISHSITALGSLPQNRRGYHLAPELCSGSYDASGRVLILVPGDGEFHFEYRFLVIKSKSKVFNKLFSCFNL